MKNETRGRKRIVKGVVLDNYGLAPKHRRILDRWRKKLKLPPNTSTKALIRAVIEASEKS